MHQGFLGSPAAVGHFTMTSSHPLVAMSIASVLSPVLTYPESGRLAPEIKSRFPSCWTPTQVLLLTWIYLHQVLCLLFCLEATFNVSKKRKSQHRILPLHTYHMHQFSTFACFEYWDGSWADTFLWAWWKPAECWSLVLLHHAFNFLLLCCTATGWESTLRG